MKPTMRTNDDAVSPVIGVMLMLVVTIIIAAVVSGFAGGLAEGAKTAPQASIAVKTGYGYNYYGTEIDTRTFDISFEHLSGDPIPTRDIEIITYLTLPNGTVVQHKQAGSSQVMSVSAGLGESSYGDNYARLPFIRDQMRGPHYNKTSDIDAGKTNPLWFGEYTLMPGQVARTYTMNATAAFLGLVPEDKLYPVNDANKEAYVAGSAELEKCIQDGCTVEVKWLHVPSGKYILNKQITLQG